MRYSDKSISFVPELHPTWKEFENFEEYMNGLFSNKKYLPYGAVKVE